MTSCDKILNQDVLTRNRCYGGGHIVMWDLPGPCLQEPVSTTSDLLVCFGAQLFLLGEEAEPGR